jgi:hypothetical protein
VIGTTKQGERKTDKRNKRQGGLCDYAISSTATQWLKSRHPTVPELEGGEREVPGSDGGGERITITIRIRIRIERG